VGCVPSGQSARLLEIRFQWLFCDVVVCCFSFVSDYCWIVLLGILPCFWSIYSCLLLGNYTISWSIDSCLWFPFLYSWSINSLNSLPGSWFVFIVEMNTLFGCFGLRLEYEYVMVVCWYRWNLLGELTVLLLIVFGFITPVIGFITPRDWVDYPCDWT